MSFRDFDRMGKAMHIMVKHEHEGGFLVVDPPGQLAKTLGAVLARNNQPIIALDPTASSVDATDAGWNPFDEIERLGGGE